jgi:hypothetical protein
MGNIRVKCPKCRVILKFDEIHIGKKGRCTKCDERFVISQPEENQDLSLAAEPKRSQPHAQQEVTNLSPLAQLINNAIKKMDSDDLTQTEVSKVISLAKEGIPAALEFFKGRVSKHAEVSEDLMLKVISLGEEGIQAAIELFKSYDSKHNRTRLIIILEVWAYNYKQAYDFLIEVSEGSVPASDFDRRIVQDFLKKNKAKSCFIATAVCGRDSEEVSINKERFRPSFC